ncbi:valine--tRNA ligase [Gracilinema caldarium]|uniref:Valine--tRNA ligase n=1 Tax=Gracilinema caldarium (strain ATCC 51460 / DSM 7334 / H1) TaxID=744872 RepID=F8F3M3_GRAC1|nr:valine--tRNA ligase [Gracilinema caldarium]AEJ19967.1 Valyl-tRNA synthetase [Gracilinema caldarium DSM 7334]
MKAVELEKAYNPKNFEDRIYAQWKESGSFQPKPVKGKKPFVVVIPPPNVTGVLHMGHGLNNSLQDIIVRFHRMKGDPTLWVPGTDHAGIATQNVVEKRLKKEGKTRHDLGREKFVEETWKVKKEHHEIISRQLAKIGASVDWSRERFTLDEGLSRAVREVFVTLYERGLLYKGNYLVNWCPSCGTALSDDEVEHEDLEGALYHIRYPVAGSQGKAYVELATTRPETLLGDTAVAVHPEDSRYTHLVGKMVELPLTGRTIPVVADTYVDKEFGTGVVKITPAHDPNDWEVAKRHNLPLINILTPDGKLNDQVPAKYQGKTVKEARTLVLEDLKSAGLFVREEKISHAVGHCYRCHTVIEPYLSEQWFVKMKPLAEKALAAWKRGEIQFFPQKWEHTYEHWLNNIRDWCISRQLWWGHRIPAWYCRHCGKTVVAREEPLECPYCKSTELEQDPDVLDTWFSSWLWPFSTLGWPKDTADLRNYYPTTTLVTAYDIIFFWVARMIMAGLEFTGQVPFRDIYIHGLVRDKQGRKMSKSLGNGLDPLELVDEFGADALKYTLAFNCAQGQDILIDKESFKLGSKFANKVWNASRYILMNLEGRNLVPNPKLNTVDRWIYARLNRAVESMSTAFTTYRFNDAAQTAYEYFWNDFCDWYVEATKISLKQGDETEKDRATTVLLDVLAESLRLLHPLLPFVTEEIYSKLPNVSGLLITAPYPEYSETRRADDIEAQFASLQDLIRQVRTLRSECTVPPEKKIKLLVRFEINFPYREAFIDAQALVALLANVEHIEFEGLGSAGQTTKPKGTVGLVGKGFETFVSIADAVDQAQLLVKFTKDLEKDIKFRSMLEAKLTNANFVSNAPAELVAQERAKLEDVQERIKKLETYLRDLA